jgi:hypothetical protein
MPDHISLNDSRLVDRINIKYPLCYDRGWRLIIDAVTTHRQYYDLYFPLSDGEKPITVDDFRKLNSLDGQREEIDEAIADSVRFVASLSRVDGAVVLTNKLRILGFGGEITAISPSLSKIRVSQDTKATRGKLVTIETYGTRHRSAFRFCSSYEDAVAFVISQDGGIMAVARIGADLIMWPDINLGISWHIGNISNSQKITPADS